MLQFGAVGGVVLGVALLDGQREAAHFLPHLNAERAGAELVEREVLALQVDRGLCCGLAHHAFRLGEALFQQHERAEHGAQGFEEGADDGFHAEISVVRGGLICNRGRLTLTPSVASRLAMQSTALSLLSSVARWATARSMNCWSSRSLQV
ncbi:hypothetical protein D9M69_636990 [compost metagenome]